MFLRFFIAAVTLWIFFPIRNLPKIEDLAKYFAVALLGNVLPFLLLIFSLRAIDSGVASIINALTPIFGLIISVLFFAEKVKAFLFIWVLVGFLGVLALFISEIIIFNLKNTLPVIASITVCLCYAFSGNFIKAFMGALPAVSITLYSQVISSLFMLPMALYSLPDSMPSISSWLCVLALGVFSTCISKLAYYYLIQKKGVSFTMLSIYLTPIFGVFFGFWLLNERLTWPMMLGLVLILISVYGVSQNKNTFIFSRSFIERFAFFIKSNRN